MLTVRGPSFEVRRACPNPPVFMWAPATRSAALPTPREGPPKPCVTHGTTEEDWANA
jgi:hypothetical protein